MRITQSMLSNNFMSNLNSINTQMEKTQYQLGSGKNYRLPEDAPTETVQCMSYQNSLTQFEKFIDNTNEAQSWLENSDSALSEVNSVLQRVNELFVQGNSDALGTQDRKAIAQEIRELVDHISTVANTSVGGRSIFAGTQTDIKPSQKDATTGAWTWQGNTDQIFVEVDSNAQIPINTAGKTVFGTAVGDSGLDLMNYLEDAVAKLSNGEGIPNYEELSQFMDKVLEQQAIIGGRANRVEFTQNRLSDMHLNITELLSKTEDADMSEVYTAMSMQQNIFRAALSAGSKIIQTSLVDFIR